MPSTFDSENLLPKLPLPNVQSSIHQALEALKPMVPENDFEKLVHNAEEFANSEICETLQSHLKKIADSTDNYLHSEGISTTTSNVYGDLRGQTLPRNPFFILEDDPMKNIVPPPRIQSCCFDLFNFEVYCCFEIRILKTRL